MDGFDLVAFAARTVGEHGYGLGAFTAPFAAVEDDELAVEMGHGVAERS